MGPIIKGRPKGAPIGAARTIKEISRATGIPPSTVYRDYDRARDLMTLEIVFAVLPRHVQRRWLRNKLAAA